MLLSNWMEDLLTKVLEDLFLKDTSNLMVPRPGWHTDAFEQLDGGSAHKSAGRFIPEGYKQPDGPQAWMDDWTMFYWGWWISWSPFVGMFIAKISRGRTIRQFINGTLTAPVFYSIMWMVIFGGAGIRMEREASNNDLDKPLTWGSSLETEGRICYKSDAESADAKN